VDPHRLAEARSLAYHRVIAERVAADLRWLDVARRRIEEWRARRLAGDAYLDAWTELLAGPVEALTAKLTEDSEDARALRQCTPFAGVLKPRERMAIHRATRALADSSPER